MQQYEEIAAHLRSAIRDGNLQPGDPLPSESELCRQFDSARGTVRQAMSLLRTEGMISSGQGRRSRVLKAVPTQSFDNVFSFSQWCHNSGITPGQQTQWVTKRPADSHLAAELEIPDRSPVVSVLRLRLMDGVPALVERLNYPLWTGQHVLTFDTDSGSIYQHFVDSGVDIATATRTIDAVAADAEDAALLGVAEGTPLLRVRRRAFTTEGQPIESSDDRYLHNLASFTINTTRNSPSGLSMITG
ncbi:GntR family transcriptional regulator [Corynebacterium testudinoris]|uniref:GntR family transcriptional regulator n=1 Tax=Corynebacterium testudinoris TaxID=136857 RepID=UPI001C8CC723|nr:GntR family transcriptional regulator [Corynebacterium testudinoris]MBX8995196.1 GntR family transcriptional regulator [Corynebacterium testudinoris]